MRPTHDFYRDDWCERRKRQLLLSALRRPRYQRAFEAGCAYGNLTVLLAPRCEQLVAADHDELALARAREALTACDNVYLSTMQVPAEWPLGRFGLIVLGEFLYYLPPEQIRQVARSALQSLEPGGEIVACHRRQPVPETGISGDEVHAQLHAALPLAFGLRHQEADFILESWLRENAFAREHAA